MLHSPMIELVSVVVVVLVVVVEINSFAVFRRSGVLFLRMPQLYL